MWSRHDQEGEARTQEYRVELPDAERVELLLLVRRGKAACTLTRAHILLAAGEDTDEAATAAALHVSTKTVERVRHRFAQAPPGDRLRWALDELPRPGAAPKLDAAAEAHLVALACSPPPEPRTCWTMQLLADKLVELLVVDGISAADAGKNQRRPWQKQHWCLLAVDPAFVARMEDALDLYAEAPDPERPLVCFDEIGGAAYRPKAGAASDAHARQLAVHGRAGTRGARPAVPRAPPSHLRGGGDGGRGAQRGAQRGAREGHLALHHRHGPAQARPALPGITVVITLAVH